jgi:hypothetical protein
MMAAPAATAAAPPSQATPSAVAPAGLATVTLPADDAAVRSLVERLPLEIAGQTRSLPTPTIAAGRVVANWGVDTPVGPPLTFQAIALAENDFYPAGWTAEQVIATMATSGDEVAIESTGQEGGLVWVAGSTVIRVEPIEGTPAPARDYYVLLWGEVGGKWVFTAAAFSPDDRDALAAAFVGAAADPGTPPASPVASAVGPLHASDGA